MVDIEARIADERAGDYRRAAEKALLWNNRARVIADEPPDGPIIRRPGRVTLEGLWSACHRARARLLDGDAGEALAVLDDALAVSRRHQPKRRMKYPWLELEIGQSVEIAGDAVTVRQAGQAAGRRYGRRFSVTAAGDGLVSIKRVAVISRGVPRLARRKVRKIADL